MTDLTSFRTTQAVTKSGGLLYRVVHIRDASIAEEGASGMTSEVAIFHRSMRLQLNKRIGSVCHYSTRQQNQQHTAHKQVKMADAESFPRRKKTTPVWVVCRDHGNTINMRYIYIYIPPEYKYFNKHITCPGRPQNRNP